MAWLTVGSGLVFGLNFVLIDQAPADAGLWPLVFARVVGHACWWSLIALVERQPADADRGAAAGWPLAAGVLDTVANVAMLLALQASLLSLAGVLISLYPAVDGGCWPSWCSEKVTRWQVVGMVLPRRSRWP